MPAITASDSQIGTCQMSISSILTPMNARMTDEPLRQVDEAVHQPDEQEVQRAQADQREGVGGEDDERTPG